MSSIPRLPAPALLGALSIGIGIGGTVVLDKKRHDEEMQWKDEVEFSLSAPEQNSELDRRARVTSIGLYNRVKWDFDFVQRMDEGDELTNPDRVEEALAASLSTADASDASQPLTEEA